MLTGSAPFIAKPRIGLTLFQNQIITRQSPWAAKAKALYDLIVEHGHDPAVWLAIGIREHRLLTDPNAVALRLQTNSWTNARSVVTPGMDHEIITDAELQAAGITNRRGPYVRYRTLEDSLIDGMNRIESEAYVYWRQRAVEIRQVLGLWTEDDGPAYTSFVINLMNGWMHQMGDAIPDFSWLDDPEHEYLPELMGEFGYPANTKGRNGREIDLFILHITIGNDSVDYLRGPAGNSAHYISWKNGAPRAQLLAERDAAWAAGNREYNERGIQYEHEKRYVDDPWTPEMYENLARSTARIISKHPKILLDRQHIIGHNEVPDPNNPGRFGGAGNHVDPGANFDWNLFMSLLGEQQLGIDPNAEEFPTGHWLINDGGVNMLDFWRKTGGLEVCGMPMTGMTRDDDGIYRQLCENVLLECWPDGFGPYSGPHYRFGGLGQRYYRKVNQ